MASTRDIRRRIKSVKNTRQITKAMELVAASKMKKAQAAALAGRPYAELMEKMLGAIADRVEEAHHPFLAKREIRTRGIILITSDKGLCGPLNSNVLKVVTDIKTPAKYAVIGRKGTQFIARTHRDLLADFPANDRTSFADIKIIAISPDLNYSAGVHADKWIPIQPNTDAAFGEVERLVVQYAAQMTRDVTVQDAVFDALKARFTTTELVELTTAIATYNMVARFLVALQITPEA